MREVWHAVNNSDVDLLRSVLESGHDVDESGGYYYAGLIFHIDHPHNGCYTRHRMDAWDPTSPWYIRPPTTKQYATPLQLLTEITMVYDKSTDYSKYIDMMRMLLEHGANVKVLKPHREGTLTPLMEIIQNTGWRGEKFDQNAYVTQRSDYHDLRLNMISQLLAHNANIYQIGLRGLMPLAVAIYDMWDELVDTLIRHGCDIDVICDTKKGHTATQCFEAVVFHQSENKIPPYHRFRPLLNAIRRILENVKARRRLAMIDALAVGFGGNHVQDHTKERLLPDQRELMRMVLDYLPDFDN